MSSTRQTDLLETVAYLRGLDPRYLSEDMLIKRIGDTLKDYRIYPCAYTHRQIMYRARRCSKGQPWTSLHDCLNPPGGSPEYGRASIARQEIVYTSWNLQTAIDEIGGLPGELIQIVGMNIVPNEQILGWIIGDVERFHNSGRRLYDDPPGVNTLRNFARNDVDKYLSTVVIDSLFSDLFSRPSAKNHDHLVTAHIAQTAYKSNMLLLYPSVRTKHALNISFSRALFDLKFQIIFSAVWRVKEYFTNGLYSLEPIAMSSSFSEDGEIDWKHSKEPPPPTIGKYGSPEPPESLRGWRPKINRPASESYTP